jgi:hypothetical protein
MLLQQQLELRCRVLVVEEASNSIGRISTVEVLRLRAINPLLGHRSAKRFAQDDGLVGGLKKLPDGVYRCTKHKQNRKSHNLSG